MNLVRGWPQGQAGATPVGWRYPSNVLPSRFEGWPAGVVPSSDAEALLESAVAWWDVGSYRSEDRWLRNRGVGGELLNLRLGSSDRVATSNDPAFLAPGQEGYIYSPGGNGNVSIVPDEAALDIAGDIDIRVKVALDSWTQATNGNFCSKNAAGNGQNSWQFWISGISGTLRFFWSPDGTNAGLISQTSSVATGFADGTVNWVRVTLDVDNGANQHEVKFYTSADGTTWTQLGITRVGAGTTSIFKSTSNLYATENAIGKYFKTEIRDGIDGTLVLDVDCNGISSASQTSFVATTGQTVSINRSTSGRKTVAVPSRANRGAPVMLFGTDDYLECVGNWQHQALNFMQSESFTVVGVVRVWGQPIDSTILSKVSSSVVRGYVLLANGSSTGRFGFINWGIGGLAGTYNDSTYTSGSLTLAGGRVNREAHVHNTFNGITNGAFTSVKTIGSSWSRNTFAVGYTPGNSYYGSMEFYGAAIFRRALTATEIRSISTYYTNRIA